MKNKICPLLSIFAGHTVSCIGDNCAWLDSLTEACCIAAGADHIGAVADAISQRE